MKFTQESKDAIKERCLDSLRVMESDMSQLQSDRETWMRTYMGGHLGNEEDGRSSIVMSDAADVIESIMPSLMRIFYGSKNVVTIDPVGKEDEIKAKLMEQKVNYDFTSTINGFLLLNSWMKDALINKIGVVKYYWKEEETRKTKEYEDLTSDEYMALMEKADAEGWEIKEIEEKVEQEAVFDEFGVMISPEVVTYDCKIIKVYEKSGPCAECIPPEEFIFPINARSIESCDFVAHKKRIHKKKLKKYGVEESDVINEVKNFEGDAVYQERFRDLGGISFLTDKPDNPDFVFIYECYVNDYDDEGEPTPLKVLIMGNKVIDIEENKYNRPPFAVLSPILMPHRMAGRGMVELVKELQDIHTTLVRYILDNIYFQNNGMRIINPFRIEMSDVLDQNVPGGIWRTKMDVEPSRCFSDITPNPLAPQVFGMIEMLEGLRENRTGVTRYQQGLDSKSLNRTATGISQIMGAAQQRVELIARIFAETGVKDLFQAFVDMNIDFFDRSQSIKINEQWVEINPDDIDGRFDIAVDVGGATGSAEIRVNQMIQMLQTYAMTGQLGAPMPAKYIYNIVRAIWTSWGYKNIDTYAPEAMTALQEMMQQQQAMMMAMGGMNGGNQGPAAGAPGPNAEAGVFGGSPADLGQPVSEGIF